MSVLRVHRVGARAWPRAALAAIAVAVAANAALMLALAWMSRGAAAAPMGLPPTVQRLAVTAPPVEPEAAEAEESAAAEPWAPALAALPVPLPALGDAPPLPSLPVPMVDVALAALPGIDGVGGATAVLPATTGDRDAELLAPIDLERFYPRAARRRGVGGVSRIVLAVGNDGVVTACDVLESSPPGVFDDAARRLGLAQRFRPATRGGVAVSARVTIPIVWEAP